MVRAKKSNKGGMLYDNVRTHIKSIVENVNMDEVDKCEEIMNFVEKLIFDNAPLEVLHQAIRASPTSYNFGFIMYNLVFYARYMNQLEDVFQMLIRTGNELEWIYILQFALDGFDDVKNEDMDDGGISPELRQREYYIRTIASNVSQQGLMGMNRFYVDLLRRHFPNLLMSNRHPITKAKATKAINNLKSSRMQGEQMQKECRNPESLLGDNWRKVPQKRRYGPLSDGYCYDAIELEKHILSEIGNGMWPSYPYTRRKLKIEDFEHLVHHFKNNGLEHSPLLPVLTYAFKQGLIDLRGVLSGNTAKYRFQQRIYNFFLQMFNQLVSYIPQEGL
jgi:hypothetical protein